MAAAAPGERPDREDLNVTSFKRGEWGSLPVPLDPGFPAVAEALGDADALTEVPQEALMAVAYASGELPKLLAGTPDDLVTTWRDYSHEDGPNGRRGVGMTTPRVLSTSEPKRR